MRVGIAGNGSIVPPFLESAKEAGISVAAICGREKSLDKLATLAEKYSIPSVYTDYGKMLASDEIDTVYVAVSNHMHYEYSFRALKAGKNVICEKPFTSCLMQAEILRNTALKHHVFLFEAITNQYNPLLIQIREDLPKLGELRIADLNFSQYSRRYDAFKEGEILPVFDPGKAGGALMDINVYNVWFMAGLFGKPERVRYQANMVKGIDTSGILVMDYGTFSASLVGAKDCMAPGRVLLQGDRGCLVSNDRSSRMRSYTLRLNDGSLAERTLEEAHSGMYYELKEFAKMLEENDFDRTKEMLDRSVMVMSLLDEARKQAGIPADFEYRIDES